jgi:hypothetical protein
VIFFHVALNVVKQSIVYSDKTDAYIYSMSMEISQPIDRESHATKAFCL